MEEKRIDSFELKTGVDGEGTFRGRASVFGVVDLHQDLVEPGAFRLSLREKGSSVVVLAQHDPNRAIGRAQVEERSDGLHVHGRLSLKLQDGRDMWARLLDGLIDSFSIGFNVVRAEVNPRTGVRHIREIDLWEVSLVTFPANPMARVTAVKHDDRELATALETLTHRMRSTRLELRGRSW